MTSRTKAVRNTSIFVVIMLGLFSVSRTAQAATLNVPAQFPTIQAAVNASNNGDLILVAPGTYNETVDYGCRNITIKSTGGAAVTTINRTTDRTVYIHCATTNRSGGMEGFRITGGGMRICCGASPTIKNCVFQNNNLTMFCCGVAVQCDGGSPLFDGCTFQNNNPTVGGNAVINFFGGVSTPVMRNCTLTNNGSTSICEGGAINISNVGVAALIENCTFTGNVAGCGGGAIWFGGDNTGSVVRNCTFTNNSGNCGGTIRVTQGARPTIEDCTVTNGSAQNCEGGGIFIHDRARPIVRRTTIQGCTAPDGAAFAVHDSTALATFEDCTFRENVSAGGSAAGYVRASAIASFLRCTWDANLTNNCCGGAGLHVRDGAQVTVTDSLFENHVYTFGDGAGLYVCCTGRATVSGTTFSGNSTGGQGGGMYVTSTGSIASISNCTFNSNISSNPGGGLCIDGQSQVTVADSTFTANSGNAGGGIEVRELNTNATITGCTFSGNSSNTGGGVDVRNTANAVITNCLFSGNSGNEGGGINTCCSATTTVNDCTFTQNFANYGAGFVVSGGTATLNDSAFTGNSASNGAGIMQTNQGILTVNRCTFTDNSGFLAGAISANNSLVNQLRVFNSTFRGNTARYGATIRSSNTAGVLLAGCLIDRNNAIEFAGAFYADGNTSNNLLINCTIANNNAGTGGAFGSAIATQSNSSVELTNCVVYGNTTNNVVGVQIGGNGTHTVTFSDIQGGFSGAGNISGPPLFADPASNNYRLTAGSPCIDTGSNAAVPVELTTDLAGNPRILDGNAVPPAIVDMGAYEVADCNANGIPDTQDIASGASTDLDANGRPDECDDLFALNLNTNVLYPTIAAAISASSSGQQILATPLAFASSPTINYAGKAIGLRSPGQILQPIGGVIDMANGSELATTGSGTLTVRGTLRTAVSGGYTVNAAGLIVNAGASLRARSNAGIDVTTSTGASINGSLQLDPGSTMSFSGPVVISGPATLTSNSTLLADGALTNSGTLTAINASLIAQTVSLGGTAHLSNVVASANSLTIPPTGNVDGYGEIYSPITNAGDLIATNDLLLVGSFINNAGALLRVQVGTTTLLGSLTNLGTIIGDLQNPGWGPTTTIIHIAGDYVSGPASSMTLLDPAWILELEGRYDNALTNHALFDMSQATLAMVGSGGVQLLEAMSTDIGALPSGFDRNAPGRFPIATLRIGPTATTVELVDARDNDQNGQAQCEALYVTTLQIESGAHLRAPACKVYYQNLVNNGVIEDPANVIQVPAACPGDFTGDLKVNGADIRGFVACVISAAGCEQSDLDGDNIPANLDLTQDLAAFVLRLTGPGTACP